MRSNLALAMLMAALTPAPVWAAAQADADAGLQGFNAMNLTPAQQRSVYQGVGKVAEVTPPEHYLIHVGGTVPASMKIQPLPADATKGVPKLKNDYYVKSDEGDLLLVKPQDRTIVEVISHYHGTVAPQSG
jgi:hypothetical protein